jgi:hypothetical protein
MGEGLELNYNIHNTNTKFVCGGLVCVSVCGCVCVCDLKRRVGQSFPFWS